MITVAGPIGTITGRPSCHGHNRYLGSSAGMVYSDMGYGFVYRTHGGYPVPSLVIL